MSEQKLEFKKNMLSVLMPVYNERAFLKKSVNNVLNAELPSDIYIELIIVNDCSTDGTEKVIEELASAHSEIRAFTQPKNMGKGAAIRRAIEEMGGEYAIIQDADLEYDPNEYKIVLRPLLEGKADVVYGSRFAMREMRRVVFYHHKLGNLFLTHLSNIFTGLDLTDMETCYKAFRSNILKTIPLRSNRFGMEPEITAKIAKRGCVVYEVPISYYGRGYAEGKKIGWKDGVQAILTILKYSLIDDCYKEQYGHQSLRTLSGTRRFNEWMASIINKYVGCRILEVSSGIGNTSRYLAKKERLTLTDTADEYLNILKNSYAGNDIVDVKKFDLNSDEDAKNLGEGEYDTVVCVNVFEHTDDDVEALNRLKLRLEDGGKIVLIAQQYKFLYGALDKHINHRRRYTRGELKTLMEKCGFEIEVMKSFNFLSIPGWWFSTCLLKRTKLSKWQLKVFDMLVPFQKIIEAILPLPGISLICVARRRGSKS